MKLLGTISDIFWSEYVWLPPNFSWEDLDPKHEYDFTNYRHIYIYPIPFALAILILRFFVERYFFRPLGLKLGIKHKKVRRVQSNVVLENAYQTDSRWKQNDVLGLAKRIDWTERQVLRWLRVRSMQGKPTTLVKFCENSWRSLYYTSSFIFGLCILWHKPWFWNIDYCWLDYPHHGVDRSIWWYYMISLAFYWSLSFSQFFDVKRKDFWQMFVHHIATICLLSFSWVCNLHRAGSLVLVIHDAADCILDGTKAAKYAKCDNICTALFAIFMFVWIGTRIIIFPMWIVRSAIFEAPRVAKVEMFPAYYVFNGLLILLLILHVYWTKLILQLAYRTWTAGQFERDIRSSDSSVDSEESTKSTSSNHCSIKENDTLRANGKPSFQSD